MCSARRFMLRFFVVLYYYSFSRISSVKLFITPYLLSRSTYLLLSSGIAAAESFRRGYKVSNPVLALACSRSNFIFFAYTFFFLFLRTSVISFPERCLSPFSTSSSFKMCTSDGDAENPGSSSPSLKRHAPSYTDAFWEEDDIARGNTNARVLIVRNRS